jgi:steroid Delta-isomerase
MPTTDQIRAAVGAYAESFVDRDRGRFMAALDDDVEQIDPVGSPPNRGRDALGCFFDTVMSSVERLDFEVRDLIVAGDEAAMVFHITQHFADGKGLEIDGVDIFRVNDDGKITSIKGYVDQDHLRNTGGS